MRIRWPVVVCLMVGCWIGVGLLPAEPSQAAQFSWEQAKGTEIRFLAVRNWFMDTWKAHLPEFEKLTGIKVVIEEYPEDPFRQKLAVELSAKSKGVDVFTTGVMREGRQFVASGWYADLNPLLADGAGTSPDWDKGDFLDTFWKAHQFGGKQIGLPVQASTQVLFYRKDLLDAAGVKPPQTLAELEAAAKKLHNPPGVYGFVARGRKSQAPYSWSHWLFANGGRWVTPDGKPGINSPAAVAAADQYVRLLRTYGDPGVTDNGPMEVQSLFLQGRAAMILDALSWTGVFNDPAKSKIAGKFLTAPAPRGPAGVTYELWGWGLAMSPFSDKQKAAWLFIQWATSKEMQRPLHFRSFPMPRKSSWTDPAWKAKVDPTWYETAMLQLGKAAPIGHPPCVASPEVTDIMGIALNNALAGKDLKGELDAAAKKMADVLDKTEPKR
ncbi:MAG TPA: sugar ABC transporter substrate-binding protein [Candidatus Sulfotelmatobacter sp.]|nr:sugar ABC transporter substrate-binding protein [Candidatus Sulfotelmatobacter sp.]